MKARILITEQCNRNCHYCCNQYEHIMRGALHVNYLWEIGPGYDEYIITGGEPGLVSEKTTEIAHLIRAMTKDKAIKPKVFLYSALMMPKLLSKLWLFDGIHYTLHENTSFDDITLFMALQNWLVYVVKEHLFDRKDTFSARLFIHPKMDHIITLYTGVWSRIEMKPWIDETTCELPEGERLFILDENYDSTTDRCYYC